MLEAGALILRTETELILKSRRVVPGQLLASGFTFQFPTWKEAADDLCRRWREHHRSLKMASRRPASGTPLRLASRQQR